MKGDCEGGNVGGYDGGMKSDRRIVKKLILALVVMVLLLGVLTVFAPNLASRFGRGAVANAINDSIHGHVTIKGLSLRWGAGQLIEGVRVFDVAGMPIGTIEQVRLRDASLWGLLRGHLDLGRVEVVIDTMTIVREGDGPTSIEQLLVDAGEEKTATAEGVNAGGHVGGHVGEHVGEHVGGHVEGNTEGFVWPDGLHMNLQVEANSLVWLDGSGPASSIDDVVLSIDLRDARKIAASLSAMVKQDEFAGGIAIDGVVTDLFDGSGALDVAAAQMKFYSELTDVPVLALDRMFQQEGKLVAMLGQVLNTRADIHGALLSPAMDVVATSAHMQMQLATSLSADGQSIELREPGQVVLTVTPEYWSMVDDQTRLVDGFDVLVDLKQLRIARDTTGVVLNESSLEAAASVRGVVIDAGQTVGQIKWLDTQVSVVGARVGERLDVKFSTRAEQGEQSGTFDVAGHVLNLGNHAGGLLAMSGAIDGRVSAVPVEAVDRLLGMDGRMSAMLGTVLDGHLQLSGDADERQVVLSVQAEQLTADATMRYADGVLRSESGQAMLRVTPGAWSAMFGKGSESDKGEKQSVSEWRIAGGNVGGNVEGNVGGQGEVVVRADLARLDWPVDEGIAGLAAELRVNAGAMDLVMGESERVVSMKESALTFTVGSASDGRDAQEVLASGKKLAMTLASGAVGLGDVQMEVVGVYRDGVLRIDRNDGGKMLATLQAEPGAWGELSEAVTVGLDVRELLWPIDDPKAGRLAMSARVSPMGWSGESELAGVRVADVVIDVPSVGLSEPMVITARGRVMQEMVGDARDGNARGGDQGEVLARVTVADVLDGAQVREAVLELSNLSMGMVDRLAQQDGMLVALFGEQLDRVSVRMVPGDDGYLLDMSGEGEVGVGMGVGGANVFLQASTANLDVQLSGVYVADRYVMLLPESFVGFELTPAMVDYWQREKMNTGGNEQAYKKLEERPRTTGGSAGGNAGGNVGGVGGWVLERGMPIRLAVDALHWPLGGSMEVTKRESDDAMQLALRVTSDGGVLRNPATGESVRLSDVSVRVVPELGKRGIAKSASGNSEDSGKGERREAIAVHAMTSLQRVGRDGSLGTAGRIESMTTLRQWDNAETRSVTTRTSATQLPVDLIEALSGLSGQLVPALGPTADVTIVGQYPGDMDISARSPNATLHVPATIDRSMVLTLREPMVSTLMLTASLRDSYLAGIHPVLADIVGAESPVKLTLEPGGLRVPLHGKDRGKSMWGSDVSGLSLRGVLELGVIQMSSRGWVRDGVNQIVGQLLLQSRRDKRLGVREEGVTYPVTFTPLVFTIDQGRLTTNELWMTGVDIAAGFQGSANLVTQEQNFTMGLVGASLVAGGQSFLVGRVNVKDIIDVPIGGTMRKPVLDKKWVGTQAAGSILSGTLGEISSEAQMAIDLFGGFIKQQKRKKSGLSWHLPEAARELVNRTIQEHGSPRKSADESGANGGKSPRDSQTQEEQPKQRPRTILDELFQ